jgi:hypothetical protein
VLQERDGLILAPMVAAGEYPRARSTQQHSAAPRPLCRITQHPAAQHSAAQHSAHCRIAQHSAHCSASPSTAPTVPHRPAPRPLFRIAQHHAHCSASPSTKPTMPPRAAPRQTHPRPAPPSTVQHRPAPPSTAPTAALCSTDWKWAGSLGCTTRMCGTWRSGAGWGARGGGELAGPHQGASRFFLAHPKKAGLQSSFLRRDYCRTGQSGAKLEKRDCSSAKKKSRTILVEKAGL